ncbi:hypothetical protein G6L16_018640 [Agrobacterium tumefaciens]|uniref:hypothetical protein n=1 Tax=Agrobacterium tumefaciens TaxID=358 RepID=UPI001573A70E|nr:hypothetical protein [Agrobacterium tumefaciens]NSZ65165.1 hypothetical protein [Agrobacterium tumefaciens]NTA71536.1 hypothetical protein [Agrobacterium tumefaciens]WIE40234.1 hypothetical protein G6L16_018640 [Agrobacterium tumefaciens]
MSHGNFRQADLQRIIRAARNEGAAFQVDLRTLVVTVIPDRAGVLDERLAARISHLGTLAPDGKDNFDED